MERELYCEAVRSLEISLQLVIVTDVAMCQEKALKLKFIVKFIIEKHCVESNF